MAEPSNANRTSRVAVFSAVLSTVAVLISVVSLVFSFRADWERESNTALVAQALGAESLRDVREGRAVVREDSLADQYLYTLARMWEAAEATGTPVLPPTEGVTRGATSWSVCFPTIDLFGGDCHDLDNFQYTDRGQIDSFSIDGLPLLELVQYSYKDHSSGEDKVVQVDVYGVIAEPDGSSSTYLLRLDVKNVASNTASISIDHALRQDLHEQTLEGGILLPTSMATYEESYGVLTLPGIGGGFGYFCTTMQPAPTDATAPTGCQWIYV